MKSKIYAERILSQALTQRNGLGIDSESVTVTIMSPDGATVSKGIPRSAVEWSVEAGRAMNQRRITFEPQNNDMIASHIRVTVGEMEIYAGSLTLTREIPAGDFLFIEPGQLVIEER